jgi:hypothetical protein
MSGLLAIYHEHDGPTEHQHDGTGPGHHMGEYGHYHLTEVYTADEIGVLLGVIEEES